MGEEQFGFMPGRSLTDIIYVLRLTMEKYREKQKGLHLVFIDLEKPMIESLGKKYGDAWERKGCQRNMHGWCRTCTRM